MPHFHTFFTWWTTSFSVTTRRQTTFVKQKEHFLFHNATADILLSQRGEYQVFNWTIHQLGFLLWKNSWARAIWLQIPGNEHEPEIFSSLFKLFFKLLVMTNSNIYFSESWLLKL